MATNPYFTPYHTQRFSFIGSPQQRNGSFLQDQRFLNMYPELIKSPISDGKKYYLKKRPGVATNFNLPAGNAQGIFYWQNNNQLYTAVNGILYAQTTPVIVLSGPTAQVGICEYRDDSRDLLFVCDGTHAWLISPTNTVSTVTDPNFPSPHLADPIFLDGYIFLAAANSQTIHNSALQDPTTWPTDGFIDAEMYPDNVIALTKAQNYIVAVGGQSVEFFYDNANATGSPLQRNAPAVAQFGCPAPNSVNQTEKEVILIGETQGGGRTIWVIDGFQPTEIANEPIREALDQEGTFISSATANTVQSAGHKWYILNLYGVNRTFVYDFEEQMWHEWSSTTGQNVFNWKFGTDSSQGNSIWIHVNNGTVGNLLPTVFTDVDTGVINCQVTTAKIDFDTIKRKRFYRLSLITDAPNGDANVPMTVQWSDDDYNNYNAGVVLNVNASYPTLTQLGYSRRRAFRFTFQQPFPLRMEAFEVDTIQEVRR